jgi:chromosome segregation ATPase
MGRRPALWVIAAAVVASGCIPRTYNTVPVNGAPTRAAGAASAARPAPRPLSPAEQRVQQLEAQLAERDREIAAVQGEIQNARQHPAPAPPPAAAEAPAAGALEAAPASAGAPTGAAATAAAATDAQLAAAQRQISTLEARLDSEVQRRKQVESEMARLLEETSAGPYEKSGNVVDQHLREQLAGAQREITDLRTTLTSERRERSDLEKRFASLQTQLERSGAATGGNDSEEIAALKERQRRVVASIQQDLLASQQREIELRASLEHSEGSEGVSLADSVTSLRAENAALQRRLDQEHQQNRELSSKLKLAGRVTDLIFKMQSSGAGDAVQQ